MSIFEPSLQNTQSLALFSIVDLDLTGIIPYLKTADDFVPQPLPISDAVESVRGSTDLSSAPSHDTVTSDGDTEVVQAQEGDMLCRIIRLNNRLEELRFQLPAPPAYELQ